MAVLLLRLEGPMQSWGPECNFEKRFTGIDPSKSGVLGLVCAALGKPRSEAPNDGHVPISELAALKMCARVDREGVMLMDFQTAHGVSTPSGEIRGHGKGKGMVTSERYYLSDASFLVGFESPRKDFLQKLGEAIKNPHWPIYLGRSGYTPSRPIFEGIEDGELVSVMKKHPWFPRMKEERDAKPDKLRMVVESDQTTDEPRRDVPLGQRNFMTRYVRTEWCPLTEDMIKEDELCIFLNSC